MIIFIKWATNKWKLDFLIEFSIYLCSVFPPDAREKEHTCECCKKKERSEKERKDMINRLSRIEGQIRGIKGMVEKDCYCPDIITQVAAANAALNSFNKVLLAQHIRTCVADGIRNGEDDKVDELVTMLQKLMK